MNISPALKEATRRPVHVTLSLAGRSARPSTAGSVDSIHECQALEKFSLPSLSQVQAKFKRGECTIAVRQERIAREWSG